MILSYDTFSTADRAVLSSHNTQLLWWQHLVWLKYNNMSALVPSHMHKSPTPCTLLHPQTITDVEHRICFLHLSWKQVETRTHLTTQHFDSLCVWQDLRDTSYVSAHNWCLAVLHNIVSGIRIPDPSGHSSQSQGRSSCGLTWEVEGYTRLTVVSALCSHVGQWKHWKPFIFYLNCTDVCLIAS